MAPSGNAALAAHFRAKRRIFSAPGAGADALVKQAQDELNNAVEEREKVAFRFDFQLSDTATEVGAAKKRKNKKKKKKPSNSTSAAPVEADGGDQNVQADSLERTKDDVGSISPAATTDQPDTKATKKKKKKQNKKKTTTQEPVEVTTRASPPPTTVVATPAPTPAAKRDVAPPPGFLKLRKPTSSDSEVMKMQLRYGRGKRNVAAIAQREKQKQAAASSGDAAPPAASSFQFNFF